MLGEVTNYPTPILGWCLVVTSIDVPASESPNTNGKSVLVVVDCNSNLCLQK